MKTPSHYPPSTAPHPLWQQQLVLCAFIFLACMVGIFSRPIGYLAAFWPANAIMLGLLLRNPQLARSPWTWVYSLLSYMAADMVTGSSLFVVLTLNTANVVGVLCAWMYLRRYSAQVLSFQRLRSVRVIFWGCLLGAAGCTLVGAWPGSIAFGVPIWRSLALWLSGEFYNFILIVPIMLAAPRGWIWQWPRTGLQWDTHKLWPLVALVISEVLSHVIGGPGAIAFLMPAMVWAAMTYGVFPVTILNGVVCFGKAAAIAMGAFSFTPEHVMEATSYRTGLALLSLAPLAVACAYVLRLQVLYKLNHAVNHDFLTGVLGRRALMERGQKLLSRLEEEGQPVAVLMADIDHFKHVNDTYGHAQGDLVLQHFAALAQETLRPEDLIGRMGGEEFAIVLPRTQREQALAAAQRLCERVRAHTFEHAQGSMHITLSVGLHAVSAIGQHETLEQLLTKADEALYAAKHGGRNQVRRYGPLMAPSSI
jgi:diguanylate cyclase (GGDEF)-like protein